jgi:D-alanine-D-alanine ligase
MKKIIALLSGGYSSEYIISVKSAEQLISLLDKEKYIAFNVLVKANEWLAVDHGGSKYPVDLNDFSIIVNGKKVKFDYAYIIIHGTPGEDGKIQAYLDLMKIPYSTGGVLNTALSFDKYACKKFLRAYNILTPEATLIRKGNYFEPSDIIEKVGLPCFVKPNNGGSSFGTSKVNKAEEIESAINEAFKEDTEVIVESYVKGTELSCGLLKIKDKEFIFPVTEIVSQNEFFDFKAKYEGMSEEITPARIDDDLNKKCKETASLIYDYLNCLGIVRVDFIARGNQLFFLEINTVPGMSSESIVPQQIRAGGFNVKEIITNLIESTMQH